MLLKYINLKFFPTNFFPDIHSEYKSTYHFLRNKKLLSPKLKKDIEFLFEKIKNIPAERKV
jgi:hypothetical protein